MRIVVVVVVWMIHHCPCVAASWDWVRRHWMRLLLSTRIVRLAVAGSQHPWVDKVDWVMLFGSLSSSSGGSLVGNHNGLVMLLPLHNPGRGSTENERRP